MNQMNNTTAEAIREFNLRAAREHLTVFTKATMANFHATWFHKKYFASLNEFAHGRIKKLMIFCPPQHGKSEGSTRRLPAFVLGKDPDRKVAIACYNSIKAEKFNREIQRIMDEPSYRELFPNTTLSNGNDGYSRNNVELEIVGYKGGLRSVGVGGGLTGETVDMLIMDDLYKDAMDAWSPLVRSNLEDWYNTVAETRLHNTSQQLIVFTRWHHEDLAAKLLSEDGHDWKVIVYPAIKAGDPTSEDPRNDGEALYPERHDIERLLGIRKRMGWEFEALYQQNPQPKEGLLYMPFKTYTEVPATAKLHKAFVDTADLGQDFLCSVAYAEDTKGIYVLDVIYTKAGMELTEPLTAFQLKQWAVTHAYIESNNGGRGFARNVESKTKELGNHRTRIEWFTQTANKLARINTNSTTVNNLVHMPEGWNMRWPEFYYHLTSYSAIGKNAHDDAPDTLTGMVERFRGLKKGLGIRALSGV